MKISMEWLGEYLPGALPAEAAGDALTNGGLPVEVIEQHGNDKVIDVEVTSNRPDCLSHIGVARELGALLGREIRDVKISLAEVQPEAESVTSVQIENPELCPHYTARIIRNVKIGASPAWLARRLEAVGLRPINNVVDVTNYIMFEMGQPLHAFDFDKLAGRRIVVRAARAKEKIISIDGHERELSEKMLVIADAEKPVALAGVMGGRDSEVSLATVNVLLESARFDPLSVRKTARRLAMKSDSSYRFERGIDPTLPLRASARAAQLILQTAGGELLSGAVETGASGYSPKRLTLRLAKLKSVLGVEWPIEQVMEALRRLHLSPVQRGDEIECAIPSARLDLNIEVDLVEEVARVVGYDKIPTRDEISIRLTPADPDARTIEDIRTMLVAAGYYEAVTFSFVSDALAGDFAPPQAAALARADASVRKSDARLRPSILPGLLEAVVRNESNGTPGAKLFEMGSTFWLDDAAAIQEHRRLALVGSADLRELRGTMEVLLGKLNAERPVQVVPAEHPGFDPAACGRIEWGGEGIGYLGKVARPILETLSLREAPAAAEIFLAPLLAGAQHVPQLRALPKFPEVRRDLSLVVSEVTRYEQIAGVIRQAKPEFLEDFEYVTTYRGKPLEKGQKSVTLTLAFRSPQMTLTSEQVEGSVQRVIASAKEKLGATLRA
ncbi:MAG TPA: phenylalanine--tRNA ligase subunit beta [Tepidisphaeraceae bacterium]|jgi:phenylalanyl-tRNA synthetase beta chain